MTAILNRSLNTATVEYGDVSLLIDRGNGKWVVIASDDARVLTDPAADGQDRKERLLGTLEQHGLLRSPFVPPARLNTLILKITKVCNYRCEYCYDMEPDDNLVHMSYDIAHAAICEALTLARNPSPGLVLSDLTVILHGGEPTLFFPFIQRLVTEAEGFAANLGKRVKFTGQTNLSRLTQEMVDFSIAHNITWGVSLDGPPHVNDRFRLLPNGQGTYQLFQQALDKYPDFVRQFGVLTTVTSHNERQLLGIARHFRDIGMPAWDWSLFQPIGMARAHEGSMGYDVDAVVHSWDELFDEVVAGSFDGFAVQPVLDYLQNFLTGPGPNMCMRNGCGAARDLLSVSSDGQIEACDTIDRRGPLGNLGLLQIQTRDSLERALRSDKAQLIRSRDVTRANLCDECAWLAVCGGTCLAHARELHAVDRSMCALAMNAFNRIAESVATVGELKRYWSSLYGPGSTGR